MVGYGIVVVVRSKVLSIRHELFHFHRPSHRHGHHHHRHRRPRPAASSSEAGDDDVANDTSKNSTLCVHCYIKSWVLITN